MGTVTRDRAAGKRIGFIPLAFDLLTIREVRAVQTLAGKADRLVVALVDDAGPHVITTADRAEIAGSLRGVDYVIVCAPDRVDALAALLTPDVRA